MANKEYPNIPGYKIKEVLGRGGMGIVYLAIQESLNRLVALKVTLPSLGEQDESFNQRFVQEANITASLNNSHIITIYDSGVFDQSSYMSMEYVSTGNLDDVDRNTMNEKQICELFIDICRGLAAAHKADLVHRDIKPDNILINEDGKAIVTDFGIVKSLNLSSALTKTGLTIGTPKYMSPEQILAKPLDGRSDLYSVGVMFYDFLEGRVPFDDLTPAAIHIQHLQSEPKNLSKANQRYQPIINKLLMKEKEDRYSTANELINDLQIIVSNYSGDTTITDNDNRTEISFSTIRKGEPPFKPRLKPEKESSNSKHKRIPILKYALILLVITGLGTGGYFYSQKNEIFTDCADCPNMVVIPAGSFQMGSSESNDEKPIHKVYIKQFSMSQTEVTFEQWDLCYNAGGCSHNPQDEGWGRGLRPVINVSWNDAQEYIRWLNRETSKIYRLPSESEWAYAAYAGSTAMYSWGESINCKLADYNDDKCNSKGTSPVKSYAKNKFGLYDMHGNVWEWVEDKWHNNYNEAPTNGSAWTIGGSSHRVLRGGSWKQGAMELRTAFRDYFTPTSRAFNNGFRLAQDKQP
jgi:formylglycine-generating enzyme required for sulfatase activity